MIGIVPEKYRKFTFVSFYGGQWAGMPGIIQGF